ncbi:kelch-like protein 5 isoform X2 [Venturia canescens]|uniref:kelch-like protein 5 isoform X2 n=1 Tax=Venturia canescens TaxID=32260 RepID=UPI001C9D5E8D|nr:kelch-like protein 5 isoform X2 [Venturia canescens]
MDNGCLSKEIFMSEHSISSIGSNISTATTTTTTQDENFSVPKHAENSLRVMDECLQRQQLTDVTIIAGGRRFPAHRLVLSAGSEYFAAMFTGSLRESTQKEVELKGVDPDALWLLIRYCYTGCIELREESVETLLATACLLHLNPVIKACCQFLIKQLHPSNCLGIRMFADTQDCSHLFSIAHAYTTKHFMEVIKNQEFLLLSADEVAKLMDCDDLNVPSEETIFHALMCWLQYDTETRSKDAGRLLGLVKLPLLSPAFIADYIECNEIFKDQSSAQKLIIEALKYHLLPERRSLLQSDRTRPRKSTVGQLLLVGGMDANKCAAWIDAYSLREDSWTCLGRSSSKRVQFGAALIDKKLIVAGGRDGLKTLNTMEFLDLSSGIAATWSVLPSMSINRNGLGIAELGGALYAVGGHDGWSFLNSVERWDPSTRQWSYVSPMTIPRSTVGVAVLNNKLYAVGGRDISSCLATVECYDPHTNKWTACAPMLKRRGGVGVGVLNGYLYALGGHDAPKSNPDASRLDCVERYDPKTDTWTMVAPMSIARETVGVCTLGDRLMAVGGYDGHQYLTLVEAYDPYLNEWQRVAPLNSGKAGPCVVVKCPIG